MTDTTVTVPPGCADLIFDGQAAEAWDEFLRDCADEGDYGPLLFEGTPAGLRVSGSLASLYTLLGFGLIEAGGEVHGVCGSGRDPEEIENACETVLWFCRVIGGLSKSPMEGVN